MTSPSRISVRLRRLSQQLAELASRVELGDVERDDLDVVVAGILGAQHQLFGPRPRARRGEGAKAKLLRYLQQNVGRDVHGQELATVSGIQEWARRIRELRVEDGYDIREVGRSVYRLEAVEPDALLAEQWRKANRIRNQTGSARDRIARFLEANVGEVVTREQIDYVAKIKEGSRRVRELRDEEGWPINSHIDEPELYPGEYRLLSTDPTDRREPSQRLYPEDLRRRVFERDGYTCQVCGRDREKALAAGDKRFYLEVHHRIAVADEVADIPVHERHDMENLVTLCHSDHLQETAKLQKKKRERRRSL